MREDDVSRDVKVQSGEEEQRTKTTRDTKTVTRTKTHRLRVRLSTNTHLLHTAEVYRDNTTMKSLLPFCLVLIFAERIHAFTIINIGQRMTRHVKIAPLNAIEELTLDALEDHEAEGTRMSASIAGWLDIEWMPQEVHVQMGESAKVSYIRAREEGTVEVMDIMTEVVDDLVKDWKQYDKDAFINAWDVGNYVSDYLLNRLGAESCGCNAQIFNPDE